MLHAKPVDTTALRNRINTHIDSIMNYVRGRVQEWDVLNEPILQHAVQDVLGGAEMAEWFKRARKADPNAKLYVNEYDILEGSGSFVSRISTLDKIVSDLIAQGAPIGGIGLQSHFNANLTAPSRVLELLDQFGRFKKDIQITEFDVAAGDEGMQAQYTKEFMTACFSHPSVNAFLVWGFWAGAHWKPSAAMIRQDWSTTPQYDVWNDLLFKQWWTDVTGKTGADGVFRTRGFLGEYEAEITTPSGTQTIPVEVKRGNGPSYGSTGPQNAPAFTGNGVVNAASFAPGAVTGGELITIFGERLGLIVLACPGVDSDGLLSRSTGDTRVYFDDVPAPMIYSAAGQVSVIVPYAVSGSTKLEVEYQGVRSEPVTLNVAPAAPGIFQYNDGTSQAVVINALDPQWPYNGSAHPVHRSSFITFFLTGTGATTPAAVDGAAYSADFPQPSLPITIHVGGKPST